MKYAQRARRKKPISHRDQRVGVKDVALPSPWNHVNITLATERSDKQIRRTGTKRSQKHDGRRTKVVAKLRQVESQAVEFYRVWGGGTTQHVAEDQ